jgi:hypothetical protein
MKVVTVRDFRDHASEMFRSDDVGEWPGALQPQALAEPYVNVSAHTAPTIRPLVRTTRQ